MTNIENNSKYEIIDNENQQINDQLDKKEDLIALGILQTIDKQISNIDIDLAIDRENNKYYFIANNKDYLNISLNINDLPEIGSTLIKLFNNNIQLFGNINGRSIVKDSLIPDGFEEKYITSNSLSKNDIEELFIFVMKSKNIPIEDWSIEETVCANGNVNNECKQDLGK